MKFLKWSLIILGSLLILAFATFELMKYQTKQASPEAEVAYANGGLKINIDYSRPHKKGRTIFGGVVPFDTTWRTGANEPTTFLTDKDLMIAGKTLPAGKYTLWVVPHRENWDVIFNTKMYGWGINMQGKASRDTDADAIITTVPVQVLPEELEQFTISLEDPLPTLVLAWDRTKVEVPLR
ncbi:MAG: DUF2911 domain-containing protein [Flavobacteriales bacterium]